MQTYKRIMRDYKNLPAEAKPGVFEKCNELYNQLFISKKWNN